MGNQARTVIKIHAGIQAPLKRVWECWTEPEHIIKWNQASDDWHTTKAENDLRVGGKFSSRMEAKDGSMGFDFWGLYDVIVPLRTLAYTLGDERQVDVQFSESDSVSMVVQRFETEGENPVELQRKGWQAILDNFKQYVESTSHASSAPK